MPKVETKINKALKTLENGGHISDKERKYLSPQFSNPPQMYGLPKIYKDGTPLRPIVSAIGSPTYRLAKKLAGILHPLAGRTDSYVKNSLEFAQRVREIETQGEMMISFDVVSLFTKVPVDDTLQAIFTLLTQDETLEERTTVPVPDICVLTELYLRSTYFMFGDTFFDQVEGAVS